MRQRKAALRKELRDKLAAMTDQQRHAASVAACALLTATPEWRNARVVMLYLSMPEQEVDTIALALRAWQEEKTVVVPKVFWDERRILPMEITSLHSVLVTSDFGVKEPAAGQPIPVNLIDLVVVPGLGFSPQGHRIGRGMGFYDRFLSQPDFVGLSCGLAFEQQVVSGIPMLDHDVPLSMLVTDQGVRRFATNVIT